MCKHLPDYSVAVDDDFSSNGMMRRTFPVSYLSSTYKVISFNSENTSRILSRYSNEFNGPNEILVNDTPYSLDITDKLYILSNLMELANLRYPSNFLC